MVVVAEVVVLSMLSMWFAMFNNNKRSNIGSKISSVDSGNGVS